MSEKEQKKDITKSEETKGVDNRFEVIGELLKVNSSIKEDLPKDYVMMRGDLAKEDYISENLENAHYAKNLILKYLEKKRPKWDKKKKDWIRDENGEVEFLPLEDGEVKMILKRAEEVFSMFMLKSHSIAVLNRNKNDNFIVKGLLEYKEEEIPHEMIDNRSLFQKMKDKFSGVENGEEEY